MPDEERDRYMAGCIMYNHNADGDNDHCHYLLLGVKVTTKRLKQLAAMPTGGNGLWSFKEATEDPTRYITYMSKGKLEPVVCVGQQYSWKECETLRQLWIEPPAKIKPSLQRYMDFETYIKGLPLECRMWKEDITSLSMSFVLRRDSHYNQVNLNEAKNNALTYSSKYPIISRPKVYAPTPRQLRPEAPREVRPPTRRKKGDGRNSEASVEQSP